jgi:SAM-dependent methyltransferase
MDLGAEAVREARTAVLERPDSRTVEGYDAGTYGERWADVYDDWYADAAEQAEVVAFLARLAEGAPGRGPVVELGVGTGLVALPLAARGVDVRGIDASPAMVAELRAKAGGADVPVTIGDMADVAVPARAGEEPGSVEGRCVGVFVAANTFFGLATEAEQRRCLERAHSVLAPGGWLAIAAFVPDPDSLRGTGSNVGVRNMTADRVVLTADRYDERAQTISGQYIDISADGIVLRPVHIRYLYPEQLDELAAAAGLHLDQRHGGWDASPFDEHATMHVSVYRR